MDRQICDVKIQFFCQHKIKQNVVYSVRMVLGSDWRSELAPKLIASDLRSLSLTLSLIFD